MTKKIFSIIALSTLLFTATIQLSAQEKIPGLTQSRIQQLDNKLTTNKAHPRKFRNKAEYQQFQKQRLVKSSMFRHRTDTYRHTEYSRGRYVSGYYDDNAFPFPFNRHREYGKAHRHTRRGWVLAYKYDRAAFYDRDGFYYGYFNRYGYFFNGIFYRYDRFYTYHDRVRGRGLFDHAFYRPAAYRHYGFCK